MTVLARYSAVLRGQGTAAPLVASVVGRLSLGMTGFGLLLLTAVLYPLALALLVGLAVADKPTWSLSAAWSTAGCT